MNKILIVEDDNTIHDMVKEYLNKRGFQCEHAYSGTEALLVQKQENCDLILMDLMLPGLDGKQALTKIKKEYDVPVIIVSAKNTIEDKVSLLAIGADDYITKPFSVEELVFRIEAILRRVRGKKNKESTLYQIGRFTFDTQKQLLTLDNNPDKATKLTTKENELLALLCSHSNEILQRDYALKTIWIDDNYFNARSMDVYITKLRKHLKADDQIEIINIHGKGYKLIVPEEE